VNAARRFLLGHVPVDRMTMHQALAAIVALVEAGRGGAVFTPNVDHVVLADTDLRLRAAYAEVDLSLADGMPVVWASHLLLRAVPEKLSGSDLTPALMPLAAARGMRVFLVGGGEGVAQRAAQNLRREHPGLVVAGTASPRIDMGEPPAVRAPLLAEIRAAAPDIVLVGFGCPKQELWIHEARATLAPAVLLGVGASLDFAAGTVARAPHWISQTGLEWLYRLGREPTRLWRRYLLRDPAFLGILLRDMMRESAREVGQ
jgi:N-acetylglucosaminyldiphosphoundecaprenol N-acetyl-beta-D-mannosaminyltransferase